MNEEEYSELLQYIRSWLHRIGRPDIDEIAFSGTSPDERPSEATVRYLDMALTQLTLESREGAELALARLNSAMGSGIPNPRKEIVLAPEETEWIARSEPPADLRRHMPDREEFLAELRKLIRDIHSGLPHSEER